MKEESFGRISTTLSKELIADIYFDMQKLHVPLPGKKTAADSRTSLAKYLEEKLRPQVPHRNSQVTPD